MVAVGLLLVIGVLPCWSAASTPTGGVRWPSEPFLACSPWWKMREMRGSVDSSYNKPGDRPDLEVRLLVPLISASRRCEGRGGVEEQRARLRRPGKVIRSWCISSTAIVARRWRSSEFSSSSDGWARGDRWPAFSALLSLTVLVERRPSFSSRPESQKGGSRKPARRPPPCLPFQWRGGGELTAPSGVVPGGDVLGPVLESNNRIGLQSRPAIWGPLCKV